MLNQFSRTQLLVGREAMERLFAGEVVKDLCGGCVSPH